MPAARESLLDAAYTALAHRPWSTVRMVDVAAVAGVSRQTLYNEFGSKEGLARALVRREADGFLAGVERALATHADARERLVATAEWTTSAARGNALVRAMLTGCWSERLPSPTLSAVPSSSAVPAQRRADGPLPSLGGLRGARTGSGRRGVVRARGDAGGPGGVGGGVRVGGAVVVVVRGGSAGEGE